MTSKQFKIINYNLKTKYFSHFIRNDLQQSINPLFKSSLLANWETSFIVIGETT